MSESAEGLVAEFMVELSKLVKKYWPPLSEQTGFASAHILIGALEQAQQKILEELNSELSKILEEHYFSKHR